MTTCSLYAIAQNIAENSLIEFDSDAAHEKKANLERLHQNLIPLYSPEYFRTFNLDAILQAEFRFLTHPEGHEVYKPYVRIDTECNHCFMDTFFTDYEGARRFMVRFGGSEAFFKIGEQVMIEKGASAYLNDDLHSGKVIVEKSTVAFVRKVYEHETLLVEFRDNNDLTQGNLYAFPYDTLSHFAPPAPIASIWREQAAMLGGLYMGALKEAIQKQEIHVAEFNGAILGFVHYYTRRDHISTIYHIAVKRAFQGQGIAPLLLWSVPCPIQLKVTQDNARAIRFYESLHMQCIGAETVDKDNKPLKRPLFIYYLHTLFIQCAGNNRKFPEICRRAGVPYGSRHDDKIMGDLFMLDIHWERYDWQHYLSLVEKHRPILAMVADYKHPDQKETMLSQVKDLEDLGVLGIMVCPKFEGAIADIPVHCRIAVSIPSNYASYLPDPTQLKGKRLHLLGGTPHKQRRYLMQYQGYGAIVSSMDGNSHEKVSSKGATWREGKWYKPALHKEKTDKYANMSESLVNIVKMLQAIGTTSWKALF